MSNLNETHDYCIPLHAHLTATVVDYAQLTPAHSATHIPDTTQNAIATANNNTAVATAQVAWVEEAFGLGIGGHNTYWMWLCYSLDAAVYPVFAAE